LLYRRGPATLTYQSSNSIDLVTADRLGFERGAINERERNWKLLGNIASRWANRR
jgi:hypothetical protein